MSTTYIFFADGELKVFLSELIAQQYCADGVHHFFAFTPRIQETWHLFPWASRTLLPWSHKSGLIKKYWPLRARIHQILESVGNVCTGADEIVIHTIQIYSERINYLIEYLRRRFPHASLKIRLIPDGTLNLKRRPLNGFRKIPQLCNRIKWFFDPQINAYSYSGDRLGADAEIVDRIYLPRGFPNQYDPRKVHWVDFPQLKQTRDQPHSRTGLVVGTAMTQTGVCTKQDVATIAERMAQSLRELGIDKAFYKPHHIEPADQLELWSPGCEVMQTKWGIERILVQQHFDLLIGNCSTALLTSKLMCPNLDVVSCGLDLVEKRAKRGRSVFRYRQACQSLGIRLIPVLTANPSADKAAARAHERTLRDANGSR